MERGRAGEGQGEREAGREDRQLSCKYMYNVSERLYINKTLTVAMS